MLNYNYKFANNNQYQDFLRKGLVLAFLVYYLSFVFVGGLCLAFCLGLCLGLPLGLCLGLPFGLFLGSF